MIKITYELLRKTVAPTLSVCRQYCALSFKDTLIVQHLLILLRTISNSRVSIHSRRAPDFDISFSLKITELS